MIHEQIKHLAIDIETLKMDARNTRRHPDENIEAIKQSLQKFGQRAPIVVQKKGMVVRAGNGRLEAMNLLGWKTVAALVIDEDDVTAAAFAIADNRTGELAKWDNDLLSQMLTDLSNQDEELLAATGFKVDDIESLLEDWSSDFDAMDKMGETSDISEARVVITCSGADKDFVLETVKSAVDGLGLVGVNVS